MQEYTIYIGADHRGFAKKTELIKLLANCHGFVKVEDLGAHEYIKDDDFNDPAKAVARAVASNQNSFGVLRCGSGQGVCMQANRLSGARAVCVKSVDEAVTGREHDWANIVCMPADVLEPVAMEKIVKALCHAKPLDTERHRRRMQKLEED